MGMVGVCGADQPSPISGTSGASATTAGPRGNASPGLPAVSVATVIMGLCDASGNRIDGALHDSTLPTGSLVGLNAVLWVVVRTSADPDANKLQTATGCSGLVPKSTATVQPSSMGSQLAPAVQLDPSQYALFFDDQELQGLDASRYDATRHAFAFELVRNEQNKALWKSFLGSPTASHRAVSVALGIRQSDKKTQPTIEGVAGSATFELQVFSWAWFWVAVVVVALVLGVVISTARWNTTLRDTLVPQLPPNEQPYSLGRCQMAFWFVLIFASFVFLYALLWDYNTVSTQALALMGISSATALASIAVDAYKDSPADKTNRALQALGLTTYADLERIKAEIVARQAQVPVVTAPRDAKRAAATAADNASKAVAGNPACTPQQKADAAKAAKDAADLADLADRELATLQAEIQDRLNIVRTYDDKVRPFRSESFFKDITTDLNGPTVHRIQVVVWTLALGGVFVVGVYRDLAMPPDFSATLLTLMGISGASYVGFKFPENNN